MVAMGNKGLSPILSQGREYSRETRDNQSLMQILPHEDTWTKRQALTISPVSGTLSTLGGVSERLKEASS